MEASDMVLSSFGIHSSRQVPRRVLVSASWLLLAEVLCSCRSDNLGFTSTEVRDGSNHEGNHVSRIEREWRANEPRSYR